MLMVLRPLVRNVDILKKWGTYIPVSSGLLQTLHGPVCSNTATEFPAACVEWDVKLYSIPYPLLVMGVLGKSACS